MNQDAKILLGITLASLFILFGGVFIVSLAEKKQSSMTVSQDVLTRNSKNRIGNENTRVTIVEFADFQCPACRSVHQTIKRINEEYKGSVMFIYRHYTLPQHKNAVPAALAAESAGEQGKFWEMYDMLYSKQTEWEDKDGKQVFEEYAKILGIDVAKYKEDVNSEKLQSLVKQDTLDGQVLGVTGTPTFFINGKKLKVLPSYDNFKNAIEKELN